MTSIGNCTRNSQLNATIKTTKLFDIKNWTINFTVIGIDEGQFVRKFWKIMAYGITKYFLLKITKYCVLQGYKFSCDFKQPMLKIYHSMGL